MHGVEGGSGISYMLLIRAKQYSTSTAEAGGNAICFSGIWSSTKLLEKFKLWPKSVTVNPEWNINVCTTFHDTPSNSFPLNQKCQPHGGAKKVRRSPESLGLILWMPWISVPNSKAIHPIDAQMFKDQEQHAKTRRNFCKQTEAVEEFTTKNYKITELQGNRITIFNWGLHI